MAAEHEPLIDLSQKLEMLPVEELTPYENNPREHPEEQVRKIADSIAEYGYTVPIIVDDEGVIIAGHGRLEAIRLINDDDSEYSFGVEEVPVIRRDDLTETQVQAFRIADNRVTETTWDMDQLAVEVRELEYEDFDLRYTGFDDDELGDLLEDDGDGETSGHEYTDRIETPVYEPSGPEPPVKDLYDAGRFRDLVEAVEAADVDDELRSFLRLAAHRHVVFDYENIAEYYAHADPEVQELMEELTLVIIDFDQAIEQGFVNFVEEALEGVGADDA